MKRRAMQPGAASVLPILILLLAVPGPAWAGWGYTWRSLTATSPNGRYTLKAIRHDEKPPVHFAYRLRDDGGKTLWQRDERPKEGWPSAIFVADDAWSVLWMWLDEGKLLVVRPDGTQAAELKIPADLLTAEERRERVRQTSTDRTDFGNRYCYTVRHQGGSYFVMRTFWDRRVVVDLHQGRPVPTPGGLDAVLDSQERKHVLATLKLASNPDGLKNLKWFEFDVFYMAIHMAGRLKVQESIPYLRAIEATQENSSSYIADEFEKEPAFTYFWVEHGFRLAAQTALRRIGEKARPLPAMTLEDVPVRAGAAWAKMPANPRDRQADQLRVGLTPRQVIELVGPPDGAFFGMQWRYDMDAERPFTLIVFWKDRRVKRILIEKRPLWQTEDRCIGDSGRTWAYEEDERSTKGEARMTKE